MVLEGQRNPLRGYLSDDGEYFEFIDGERRKRAAEYINANTDKFPGQKQIIELKCELEEKIGGKKISGTELIFRQLSYGTNTEPLSPFDQAAAVKELVDSGVKVAEIATRMGRSDQHVRNLLKMVQVDPDIKEAVSKGAISATAALKTTNARQEARNEVKERVARGERVRNKDVDLCDGKQGPMKATEIDKQIKVADKYFNMAKSDREREKWGAMIEAFRITLRQADPLS